MNDTAEPARGEDCAHRGFVTHVDALYRDARPSEFHCADSLDARADGGVRGGVPVLARRHSTSARKHNLARAAAGEKLGKQKSDFAESAGNQVGAGILPVRPRNERRRLERSESIAVGRDTQPRFADRTAQPLEPGARRPSPARPKRSRRGPRADSAHVDIPGEASARERTPLPVPERSHRTGSTCCPYRVATTTSSGDVSPSATAA